MHSIKTSVLMTHSKLKTERRQQGWTQARLAEALGVTTRTVIRWEQGKCVPQASYRRRLGTLLGKSAQELGLLWNANEMYTVDRAQAASGSAAPIPIPDISAQALLVTDPIPGKGGSSLLGRAELLMQAKEHLLDTDRLYFLTLSGLPGAGKTSLAMALATDQDVQDCFRDGILWAPLGRRSDVLGQLTRWGRLLGITSTDVKNPQSCESWRQALQSAIGPRQMLLVIDDVWTVEDARALQVGGAHCTCLLTTSLPQVARAFTRREVIMVPQLEEADGLALLACFVPHLVQQDPEGARSLMQAVDCLPLTLKLMGKYLASSALTDQPWPLQAALHQLHDIQECLRLSSLTSLEADKPSLIEQIPLSLHASIAICVEHLNSQAYATLCALSLFPPNPQSFSEEAALVVSQQSREVLDELWDSGLLERGGLKRYSMRQMIVDYIRARK